MEKNIQSYGDVYQDENLNVVFEEYESQEDAQGAINDKIEMAVAKVEDSDLSLDEKNAKVSFLNQIRERSSKIIFDQNFGSNLAAISLMVLALTEIIDDSVDSILVRQARFAAIMFGLFGARIQSGVNDINREKQKNLESAV